MFRENKAIKRTRPRTDICSLWAAIFVTEALHTVIDFIDFDSEVDDYGTFVVQFTRHTAPSDTISDRLNVVYCEESVLVGRL